MKKISRRSFLAVCGAMAATAALTACGGSSASTAGTAASGSTAGSTAGSAASGEVFELKLSTTQTDTSMIYQGLQAAADKVAEDTDGHVKVTIYPSSQLGGEEDMIDQALQGMGIAVLTDAGRLSSYVNDIGIMNMAYIVDNYEDGMKLMATDTFKGWDADLANNGICGLCYNYYDGARSFMGHKPYNTPADLKGAVIRTPGADPYVESISAMALPRTTSHGLRSTTASRPSPSTAAKSSTPLLFPARSTRSASTSARPSTSTCLTWSSAVRHGSTSCPPSIRKS